MSLVMRFAGLTRSPGDPEIVESGPGSRDLYDTMAQGLGWFSIGLGVTELLAAGPLARALGMDGKEGMIRAFGAREIIAGMTCLSVSKQTGVWSRVGGDGLDIAALLPHYSDENPKKGNVMIALAAVAGVTLLDIAAAKGLGARHGRDNGGVEFRDYGDRSGWPNGLAASRRAAEEFRSRKDAPDNDAPGTKA